MRIEVEVVGTELGTLRARNMRLLEHARPGTKVGVLVLGADGEPPFVGEVMVGAKLSGRSKHLAILCPKCQRSKFVLYARAGALGCAPCARRRTRRQRERTLASWRRGGREEDRLLRSVGHGRLAETMRRLAEEIVEGDADRASVVLENFHHVLVLMEGTYGSN